MGYHVGQHEIEKEKLKSLFPSEGAVGLLEHVGAFCAGGAITSLFTNKEVNDLDIYFPSREALVKAVESLFGGDDTHELICTNYTDKSILFTKEDCDIQFIYFDYFSTPEQIFQTFDFTACMGAYDFKRGQFAFHEDFFKHNSQKRLKFNTGTAFPLLSALRVNKYQEKGYEISKTEYLRVIMSAMKLNLTSWTDLKEHIGGFYGTNVDNFFDEEKEFSIEEAVNQLQLAWKGIKDYSQPNEVDYTELFFTIMGDDYEPQWFKWVEEKDGELVSRVMWRDGMQLKYQVGEHVNGGQNGVYCFERSQAIHWDWFGDSDRYKLIELEPLDKDSYETNGREAQLFGDVLVKRIVDTEERWENIEDTTEDALIPF